MAMPALQVLLLLVPSASVPFTIPDWDWEPANQWESCIAVDDTRNGGNFTWKNNSRFVWTAVPPGPAPASGWPVLMDFSVLDFQSGENRSCGLDGVTPADLPPSMRMGHSKRPPENCTTQTNYTSCLGVYALYHLDFMAPCRWSNVTHECTSCNMTNSCYVTPPCNAPAYQNSTGSRCPGFKHGKNNPNSRCVWNTTNHSCVDNLHPGRVHRGFVENFRPFQSPYKMGMQCSCFAPHGLFNCTVPKDNGQHPSPRNSVGCSLDDFAGGIWFQRIKQLLLSNGIAVAVLNPYIFDGWDAYETVWQHGQDPPFLQKLAQELSTPAGSFKGLIDPKRVAFHGWSGSAQMVSWSFNMAASGQLPGLKVKAGVMMAGGSHACYDMPQPYNMSAHAIATGVCSNCNPDPACKRNGSWPYEPDHGCSSKLVAAGERPCCMFCCPDRYTERWYAEHPEDYNSHPATFLGQTEVDSGADSCAASHCERLPSCTANSHSSS